MIVSDESRRPSFLLKRTFMKKTISFFALIAISAITVAQPVEIIKITGTKFPFEIMQQWIDAYSKTHSGVQFQLSKAIPLDSADLMIAAHGFRPGELKDDQVLISLNRYAQLPIANSNRSDLKTLQQKGFTQQDLKNIYFNAQQNKTDGLNEPVTIYRREKNVCASRSFAENVTGKQLDVAGELVNGDDRALSNAVKNDVNGISYNNLGLIYDLKTRRVADSIAVIPIDLNENGKIDADENIYATLDDVLNFLSASTNNIIPQDNVNIVINKTTISKPALDFLNWIITQGQQYDRAFGFLDLDRTVVLQEQKLINNLINDNALIK
jgi:phosphate transport system substrate-binding protein